MQMEKGEMFKCVECGENEVDDEDDICDKCTEYCQDDGEYDE